MFYKKVNKKSDKDMFNFLKNHYEYDTMNSWNNVKSIANNVKVYNLGLKGDWSYLLKILETFNYHTINRKIEQWEEKHSDYRVGFNGRSGGYLVLYNNDNCKHIFDNYTYDFILASDNYEDFKDLLKDYGYTMKDYHNYLVQMTRLVQDFDKLCDDLVVECQYLLDNYEVAEEEILVPKTVKTLKYKEKECE